jgi:hypothetical protein
MDWIKTGWGNSLSQEFSESEPFTMDIRSAVPNGSLPTPLVATLKAVDDIVKNYPPPYSLFCSGGVDSQAMIYAWYISGHPFTIVSIKYISNGIWFNDHDLNELMEFTRLYELPVTYYDFDVNNFLETRLMEYATNFRCTSPQICTYMAMSELVTNGTILFSGNFMSDFQSMTINFTIMGLSRYTTKTKRSIIPFFFLHDPALAMSFINTKVTGIAPYESKFTLFQKAGFPVVPQPQKFSGFEKIKDYYDQIPERVSTFDRLRFSREPSKRLFDVQFRYKLKDTIKYIDNIVVIS